MEKHSDNIKIAPNFTIGDWKELRLNPKEPQDENWNEAIKIFDARIRQRFIEPADILINNQKDSRGKTFGFAILALDFLVMETLQGFRDGKTTHNGESKNLIEKFLKNWDLFINTTTEDNRKEKAENIYKSYRCAIHHSGSTDNSFLIGISGDAFDFRADGAKINRNKFHKGLKCEFNNYQNFLRNPKDMELRKNFITKMNYICDTK